MTPDVITLGPDVDHAEAARVMKKAGIKRIPVVDEGGKLIGLVSRSDILRAFARSDGDIVAEIRDHLMRKVLWIDPRLVDIVCEDGNLVLIGNLETRSDASLLVELTGRLDGVVSVNDRLTWTVDNTKVEMVASPRPVVPNW
jgi:CBS domain-containing protein